MNPSSRIGRAIVRAWLLAAVLAWLAAPPARAQNDGPSVSASLLDASVEAGQPTEYQIKVVNGTPAHVPLLPEVNGLTISTNPQVGRSEYSEFGLNFQTRRVATFTFTYRIDTSRPGQFTIPGLPIDLGGASLHTLPTTLTVLERGTQRKGPAGLWLAAELTLPKKSAYVGESVPAEFHAFFGLAMHFEPDPDPTLQGEGFSLQKFTHPRVDLQTVQGAQVHVASYKTTIAGARVGRCTVGPAEVQPAVQIPWSPREVFTDPNNYQLLDESLPMVRAYYRPQKRVKVSSGTVDIEIKPLPPGRPAAFSGAIGEFKLEAEADPRKAQVGDPVTIRLMLSGRGNFERIAAPVCADEQGLRLYPATARFKASDEINLSGVKTFEQVVIAEGARTTLPAYRFNYLDPVTGKYAEIETAPVPVEIVGGPTPTPAASAPPVAAASATPMPTPRRAEDIFYIRTDPGPTRPAADFLPPYRRRSFWAVQGGVCAALAGLGVLGKLRQRARGEAAFHRAQVRRQQQELERALGREEIGRGEFYASAAQLARLRAAAASEPAEGPVAEILRRHDELAFSGAQAAREPVPVEERRSVLTALKNLDKPRG